MILPYLGRKYDYQLYRLNEMWLYSNPGIGVTNEPLRINCPRKLQKLRWYGLKGNKLKAVCPFHSHSSAK
jgi:hypothetical protein